MADFSTKFVSEMLAMMVVITIGDGVIANEVLLRTKGHWFRARPCFCGLWHGVLHSYNNVWAHQCYCQPRYATRRGKHSINHLNAHFPQSKVYW
jgi:glycerol uptake facilitator-like aquaporin